MPLRSLRRHLNGPKLQGSSFPALRALCALGNKTESQKHLEIFERLNREDQERDRAILQQSQEKR